MYFNDDEHTVAVHIHLLLTVPWTLFFQLILHIDVVYIPYSVTVPTLEFRSVELSILLS